MIHSDLKFLFLLLLIIDDCDAFVAAAFPKHTHAYPLDRRRNKLLEASLSSLGGLVDEDTPVLEFNFTSLLQIDYAKRIHLLQLYEDSLSAISTLMSSSLPTRTTEESFSEALDPFRRFLQPYDSINDMNHHGRFVLPPASLKSRNTTQERRSSMTKNYEYMTMPSNVVFAMDDPLCFLQNHASFRSSPSIDDTVVPTKLCSSEEIIVMLSNVHTSLPTSWQQLEYVSKVLTVNDRAPTMSLLHVGTFTTNGRFDDLLVPLHLTRDTLEALKALGLLLLPTTKKLRLTEGQVHVKLKDIDLLRALCCSCGSLVDSEDSVVETLIKLIDIAVTSSSSLQQQLPPRLVLMSSSIQSIYVISAIAKWKEMASHKNHQQRLTLNHSSLTEKEAQRLLQRAGLTVVTMGSLIPAEFPEGPSYINVCMYDDVLANAFSPLSLQETINEPVEHDGSRLRAPLVLHAMSPYPTTVTSPYHDSSTDALYGSDAHNMLACSIQFLHLLLRINGISTFHELFDQGSQPTPTLDIPPSLFAMNYMDTAIGNLELPQDEILWAFLQAMQVEQWLWNTISRDEDEVLPHWASAKATVEAYFGYDVYEEIQEAN